MSAAGPILTFDCYGTLVDWRAGIVGAFRDSLPTPVDDETILVLHAEIEPRVQAGEYKSYRQVLRETSARIFERLGLAPPAEPDFLPDSLAGWPPFADTRSALERLRRGGFALGILSNVDNDLLAETVRVLEVGFELLVTAQSVGSYKPAPGHFDAARELIGDRPWIHVAQSLFHDIVPAAELGIPAVWIDRLGETPPEALRGVRRFADLAGLATDLSEAE